MSSPRCSTSATLIISCRSIVNCCASLLWKTLTSTVSSLLYTCLTESFLPQTNSANQLFFPVLCPRMRHLHFVPISTCLALKTVTGSLPFHLSMVSSLRIASMSLTSTILMYIPGPQPCVFSTVERRKI